MSRPTWRDRPRRIAKPCAGCGAVIIGTSLRAFDEARAEHYEQAHGVKRPRPPAWLHHTEDSASGQASRRRGIPL